MNPSAFAQCFESLLIGESRVRRCQPEATPQVGLAFSRKCLDGADNKLRIPSIDEPEGTAQALVENTFSVTLNPGRPARLRVNVFGPMEKTLVKPPAIERQPAQQRVKPPTGALDANNAQQVLALIRKLCDEVKASLLLVSHDPAITAQFPRVVTLSELNRASVGATPASPVPA